jgi:archaellum biogenesis protein FlaJ (TadC family)
MNGAVFDGLNKLNAVYLTSNDCINRGFFNPSEIATMHEIVSEKCDNRVFLRQQQKQQMFIASIIAICFLVIVVIAFIVKITKCNLFRKQMNEKSAVQKLEGKKLYTNLPDLQFQ